jgi:hypothetical protein
MSVHPRHTTTVLALLTFAGGCDDGPTPAPEPPRIRFEPQAVSFPAGANGAGFTTGVGATVTGVGPAPTLRWESRAPDAVAVDSVAGSRGVVLRGVNPRHTHIVLTATGTATVRDSLPVTTIPPR